MSCYRQQLLYMIQVSAFSNFALQTSCEWIVAATGRHKETAVSARRLSPYPEKVKSTVTMQSWEGILLLESAHTAYVYNVIKCLSGLEAYSVRELLTRLRTCGKCV